MVFMISFAHFYSLLCIRPSRLTLKYLKNFEVETRDDIFWKIWMLFKLSTFSTEQQQSSTWPLSCEKNKINKELWKDQPKLEYFMKGHYKNIVIMKTRTLRSVLVNQHTKIDKLPKVTSQKHLSFPSALFTTSKSKVKKKIKHKNLLFVTGLLPINSKSVIISNPRGRLSKYIETKCQLHFCNRRILASIITGSLS